MSVHDLQTSLQVLAHHDSPAELELKLAERGNLRTQVGQIFAQSRLLAGGVDLCLLYVWIGNGIPVCQRRVSQQGSQLHWAVPGEWTGKEVNGLSWRELRKHPLHHRRKVRQLFEWVKTLYFGSYYNDYKTEVLCAGRLNHSQVDVGTSPFEFVSGTIPNLCSNWRM